MEALLTECRAIRICYMEGSRGMKLDKLEETQLVEL
jgi:hypothetical protein